MTHEATARSPHSAEQSPIRNGRLYFKDLKSFIETQGPHRLIVTATSTDGTVSRVRFTPVSIRESLTDPDIPEITLQFNGSDNGGSFGCHRLDGQGEVMQIKPRNLIEIHTNGHLVIPGECRPLSKEFIEIKHDWDMAFDILREGRRIPIAAHKVQDITFKKMKNEIVLPRGLQRYIDRVQQAPRF